MNYYSSHSCWQTQKGVKKESSCCIWKRHAVFVSNVGRLRSSWPLDLDLGNGHCVCMHNGVWSERIRRPPVEYVQRNNNRTLFVAIDHTLFDFVGHTLFQVGRRLVTKTMNQTTRGQTLGPNLLIISFSLAARMDFLQQNLLPLLLSLYANDVGMNEISAVMNTTLANVSLYCATSKRLLQWCMMSTDPSVIMYVEFFVRNVCWLWLNT